MPKRGAGVGAPWPPGIFIDAPMPLSLRNNVKRARLMLTTFVGVRIDRISR